MQRLEKGLAALVLIALAPLFPILWILNRLEDGGEVFYRQARLGKGRILFRILKLRTMQNGRVTRLGSLLRPAGIDELPQFYNVLRGEMRLIGPRPVTEEDTIRWNWIETDPRWSASPGMSGLPGVLGTQRGRDALRLERFYATHKSAKLDFSLLGMTFMMLFLGKRRVRDLKTIVRRQFAQSRRNRQSEVGRSKIKIGRPVVP
jgi:lipopolysaccharide/colanic/teichoic acid biosynthesis glycosyltransferase